MPTDRRHRTNRASEAPTVSVIGRGAYPVSQVSRLLSLNPELGRIVSPASIRRWAYGYRRRHQEYKPAITSEQFSRATGTLSFLEVVEILFIASSLATGVKWSKVHKAALVASRVLANEKNPFAHRRWFADPHGIYLKLGQDTGEEILIEMAGNAQISMEAILRDYLKQIVFNKVSGMADAWYPLGPEQPVVIDPQYSFGLPIVKAGVRTDILAGHFRGGDTVPDIAYWYDVPEYEVEAAIRFEDRLRLNAA